MGLETPIVVSDLVPTNPSAGDPKSQGDDHIRGIKTALLNSLPGFAGAIMASGVDGGSSNSYTLTPAHPLPAYGLKMLAVIAPTFTNTGTCTLDISGLGPKSVKTLAGADATGGDLVAGMAYVLIYTGTEFRMTGITQRYIDNLAFAAVLPGQTGNAGKVLRTDGSSASWSAEKDNDLFTAVAVAASDVNLALGRHFTKTVTAPITFTFSNVPAGGTSFTLDVQLDAGSIVLPASVKPYNGVIPTLATGKTHSLHFITINGGARWRLAVGANSDN